MNKNKPIMAYISYPFTGDPVGNTKKVCSIAREIMVKHPNIFVIVPHVGVDIVMFGDTRRKYDIADHILAPQLEFTVLSRIDMFIQGIEDKLQSPGCIWEKAYCLWLNRIRSRKIMIVKAEELTEDKD